eukprot:gb/GEZN01005568.1/.p1 GENE.gb/GEZN01005568.1/~~gb/GEZN01005568.1/.p1  ORF type:complete len:483 (-),score=41.76 gb/GEZN01005568.1/:56-1504(-)
MRVAVSRSWQTRMPNAATSSREQYCIHLRAYNSGVMPLGGRWGWGKCGSSTGCITAGVLANRTTTPTLCCSISSQAAPSCANHKPSESSSNIPSSDTPPPASSHDCTFSSSSPPQKTYTHTRSHTSTPTDTGVPLSKYPLKSPIRHVLVFEKLSTYQQAKREQDESANASAMLETQHIEGLFREDGTLPHATDRRTHVTDAILTDSNVLKGERENAQTLEHVKHILTGFPELEVHYREIIDESDVRWADLVISVGGDGTFLKVARTFDDSVNAPLLGVNSSPSYSFGFFCATDGKRFPHTLKKILAGTLHHGELWRMELLVNGTPVKPYVLNDILLTHQIPSATCRYTLTNEGLTANQRSSGMWISTSAGSTGALLNAGGQVFPLTDRRLQYRVRELNFVHRRAEPRLLGGVVAEDFKLVSKMQHGMLYLDGDWRGLSLDFNDIVTVRRVETPLLWFPSKKEIIEKATRHMQFRMGGWGLKP